LPNADAGIAAVPVTAEHDPPVTGGGVDGVVLLVTVRAAIPVMLPTVAVMFVVPTVSAVTRPAAAVTEATDDEELVHDTVCPVSVLPFASLTVAVACAV
jgi:hypothetical protein